MLGSVVDQLINPDLLEILIPFVRQSPPPAGPLVAEILTFAVKCLREGKSVNDVKAMIAKYSDEAQVIADDWFDDADVEDAEPNPYDGDDES